MKIIIVGYGRMGSGLASKLLKQNHKVTVIDNRVEVINSIDEKNITAVKGIGFDKDVLELANIEKADTLVACTNSDETNALVARIAKNIYKVPNVIARLYDPEKADIYNALGIRSISTTSWGIARASEIINYSRLDSVMSLGSGTMDIVKIDVPIRLDGHIIDEITVIGEIQPVGIYRDNKAHIPTMGFVLQQHDILYVSVISSALKKLKQMTGLS